LPYRYPYIPKLKDLVARRCCYSRGVGGAGDQKLVLPSSFPPLHPASLEFHNGR
jgi:hypothetical protein